MSNEHVFFVQGDDPAMLQAAQRAQDTFKYFWRELSWEYRRVVPALDVALVKAVFTQETGPDTQPIIENMWVTNIAFDGEFIYGILANKPDELTNIDYEDEVKLPLTQISDWLMVTQGQTYGGFSIHVIRAAMTEERRKVHDEEEWELNFGDPNDIQIVYQEKENPDNLIEHPMSIHMREKVIQHLQQKPGVINDADEAGYTLLHKETINGNKAVVEELIFAGADASRKTNTGKTALDFAISLNWEHIIPLLAQ